MSFQFLTLSTEKTRTEKDKEVFMIGLKTPTNSDALNNGSTNLRQVDPFQDVESYFESTTYVLKGTYDVISC